MKTPFTIKISITLVAIAIAMAACQPNGSKTTSVQETNVTAVNGSPTGTVAGGDASSTKELNGVLLETYSFNPTLRAEWKEYVTPIFSHLSTFQTESNGVANLLQIAVDSKRWYLVPVPLDQLMAQDIKAGFLQDPLQRLARQSEKEVWFDKEKFDTNPDEALSIQTCADLGAGETCRDRARAFGLLEQTLLSLYPSQFLTMGDFCRKYSTTIGNCESPDNFGNPVFAPKPKRALVLADYTAIRTLTAWLMQNGTTADSETVKAAFLRNGFDVRLWNRNQAGIATELDKARAAAVLIPRDLVVRALVEATVLGYTPKSCHVADGANGQVGKCFTKFQYIDVGSGKKGLQLDVYVQNAKGDSEQRIQFVRPIEELPAELSMPRENRAGSARVGYSFYFGVGMAKQSKLEVGANVYRATVFMTDDLESVEALWLQHGRIAEIRQNAAGDSLREVPSGLQHVSIDFGKTGETVDQSIHIVRGELQPDALNSSPSWRTAADMWLRQ